MTDTITLTVDGIDVTVPRGATVMTTYQEQTWQLQTPDGAIIYGVCASGEKKSDKALFIVHGLTGHMNEYHLKRASHYFVAQGYDVYNFNLYAGEEKARRLIDCTLAIHAQDFQCVLDKFAGSYEQVFAIGHSYGGTTVVMANATGLTATSLWEPTYDPKTKIVGEFGDTLKKLSGFYSVDWGVTYLIGDEMYNEAFALDASAFQKMAEAYQTPMQVVLGSEGEYINEPASFDTHSAQKTRRDVIQGAGHCFNEGHTCENLLEVTQNWFKEHQA